MLGYISLVLSTRRDTRRIQKRRYLLDAGPGLVAELVVALNCVALVAELAEGVVVN